MNRGGRGHPNRGGGRFSKPRTSKEQRGPKSQSKGHKNELGGKQTEGQSQEGSKSMTDVRIVDERRRSPMMRLQDQRGSKTQSRGQKNEFGGKQTEGQPKEGSKSMTDVRIMDERRRSPMMRSQAPVQNLFMSAENQEMLHEVLRELDGSIESDDEADSNLDHARFDLRQLARNEAYWKKMGDQRLLIVDEDANFGQDPECSNSLDDDCGDYNPYAVKKLLQCGFEKKRSLDALGRCDGDMGLALEQLLSGCCGQRNLGKTNPDHSLEKFEDAKLQRAEELVALQSIYEDRFSETIPDSVWVIRFDLPFLKYEMKPKVVKEKLRKKKPLKLPANICKFFVQGHCRFGDRCRMTHKIKEDNAPTEQENQGPDLTEDTAKDFHLEVRFPEGSLYPFEPPLVAFYCSDYAINAPLTGFLNVTLKLNKEAKVLCDSESPAVFSLINILETEDEVLERFRKQPSEFSLPEDPRRPDNTVVEEDDSEPVDQEDSDGKLNSGITQESKGAHRNARDEMRDKDKMVNIGRKLKQKFQRIQSHPSYKLMLEQRKKLPAWNSQQEIITTLQNHQVLVISGMTGCGKTTQIPQFILDTWLRDGRGEECFIVCTQPRRISATSVAERVASERAEKLGETVGYQIRLESKQTSMTRLLYCTTGILLRRLEGESELPGISHVIVDEVHERTEESDFLMMVLKDLILSRPDLRVVLMSATLNAKLFSEYFYDAPVIHIPGRTFPVEQYFLEDALELTEFQIDPSSPYAKPIKRTNTARHSSELRGSELAKELRQACEGVADETRTVPDRAEDQDLTESQMTLRYHGCSKSCISALCTMNHEKINYDLIISILEWIVDGEHEHPKSGAVLVFLPGMGEIMTLHEQLQNHTTFSPKKTDRFSIIPLHSTLSSEEQSLVFRKPKQGVRKIVLSTNIAETSVTIDDVVYVIDSGKMKENRYDSSKGMESLEETWVSKANAQQRRGRAGRVTSGVCFHLCTRHRFDHHFDGHQKPEIQRVPLEKLCLRIKVLGIFFGRGVKEVLGRLLEPPSISAINDSITRLHNIGALDALENLTSLGFHLAALPVDVRIGKLMLLGAIFRCLDPVLTIAAILSYRSPFTAPFEKREEADKKRQEMSVGKSDHLTLLEAYKGWLKAMERGKGAGYQFCYANFLSMKTLEMIASLKCQYVELLSDIGFIKGNLSSRKVERMAFRTGDGVFAATGKEANINMDNHKLVLSVLCASLFPNVAQVVKPKTKYKASSSGAVPEDTKASELKFWTENEGQVYIHPKSVNFQVNSFESPFLVFHEKVKTSKVYIRDASMVSVYSLLLFCGDALAINLEKGQYVISIDNGWIRFIVSTHQLAKLVRSLRQELDQLLADKIEKPSLDLLTCPRGSRIIDTIVRLITTQ